MTETDAKTVNDRFRVRAGTDASGQLAMLEPHATPDRLPPMLFLAALIHGILIIGITFNAFVAGESNDAISLEVTIVADPDPNAATPARAAYLAQANQDGAGNTQEQARPRALAESMVPVDNVGTETGTELLQSTFLDDSADQVLTTRSNQDVNVRDVPRDNPQQEVTTAAHLEAGIELTRPLPQDVVNDAMIHDRNPRQLVTSVDTRESSIAGYLSRWKSKIETVGIKYFPEAILSDGVTGSPTLEVTIDASGQLQNVLVKRSSGSRALDQVALSILQRAAPFDPFPEAVRVDYDQLRFAYKWQFNRRAMSAEATARVN